ncbi:hypothetical protein BLOT_008115 [Blomia tropicalis]|nr:hypothetical protein BLOT_008115 [Blomia tropicalis]
MDQQESINFNKFPFKLRFSSSNKYYHEIARMNQYLNNVLRKMIIQTQDKSQIKLILDEVFTDVAQATRLIQQFLNHEGGFFQETDEMKKNSQSFDYLRKLVENRFIFLDQDEQERHYFQQLKEVNVVLQNIPNSLNQSVKPSKLEDADVFSKDYKEINQLLNMVNNRIRFLKNKIELLNENIIWLYLNIKENLKVFIRFREKFNINSCENEKLDSNLQSILNFIEKIFDIFETKIDLFSNSPKAYTLKISADKLIRIELRKNQYEKQLNSKNVHTTTIQVVKMLNLI